MSKLSCKSFMKKDRHTERQAYTETVLTERQAYTETVLTERQYTKRQSYKGTGLVSNKLWDRSEGPQRDRHTRIQTHT